MFPPGLEPGTFRVLGERDNHYTTETPADLLLPWGFVKEVQGDHEFTKTDN